MGCGSGKTADKECSCLITNNKKCECNNMENTIKQQVITKEDDIKILHNKVILASKGVLAKNYKVDKKIGAGAFAKVYMVTYLPLRQKRAMKVVKRDTLHFQDDERAFLKEIEILTQLDHPNIIKLYEYYCDDINYYVITEFVSGGELYEQIYKFQAFTEEKAAIIMKQLLSAVCYMHSKGIIHRDLKPENIMLESLNESDLSIKIIDFGTSNYCKPNRRLSLKVGIPYYIAPEVLSGNYDNKYDIWSIGVIMFVLLSGSPPFDGPNEKSILQKVKKGIYSMTGDYWEHISSDAKDLIKKMLTYDPNLRISAVEALSHPWFHGILSTKFSDSLTPSIEFTKIIFEKLRNFNVKQKIQQATIAFLVHHASSSDMIQNLKKIFKTLDVDGNGTLSYEELWHGFKKYYGDGQVGEKEFNEIMKVIDRDKNDCIEYEEFIAATINLEELLTEDNMKLAFNSFDTDGSQALSIEEIKVALGILESETEVDVIKNIIKKIDTNGDEVISFEEFKKLMLEVLEIENK